MQHLHNLNVTSCHNVQPKTSRKTNISYPPDTHTNVRVSGVKKC